MTEDQQISELEEKSKFIRVTFPYLRAVCFHSYGPDYMIIPIEGNLDEIPEDVKKDFERQDPSKAYISPTLDSCLSSKPLKVEVSRLLLEKPEEAPRSEGHYVEVKPSECFGQMVTFGLMRDYYADNKVVGLVWVKNRNEWVATLHYDQYEDNELDEWSLGPYVLDNYCKEVLSKTYGVDRKSLESDISKINPSDLEKAASGGKN